MSQEDLDALKNASAIIERFGGIRPMAAKVGAPVTTVQGWKKRDVIPGARRDDVLKAANENSIDLSDLLSGGARAESGAPSFGNGGTAGTQGGGESAFIGRPASGNDNHNDEDGDGEAPDDTADDSVKITVEPILRPQHRPLPSSLGPRIDTTHEELMAAIAQGQKKAVRASVWTVIVFSALIGGAAALALWPSAQKIERHEDQIATLEGKMGAMDKDVQALNDGAGFLKEMVPDDIRDRLANLRKEAETIGADVKNVAQQAQDISRTVLAADAGSLSDRLSILEAKLGDVEGGQAIKDLAARIRGLEVTVAGQTQLGDSVAELTKIVDAIDGQVNELDDRMAGAQKTPGSALGETLEGISDKDLKAAALLIAFSQLRDSLNRNTPFSDDLVLLQKLVGNDDPELQTALQRLAPQAEQGGVLTSAGLADELKTLSGDIVFASLKGEEVSPADKAKVRLTQILNVKKDGELVGGTPTQKLVTKAQEQLEKGDVQGAIATLDALDGEAKNKAQPLIDQAQAAVLADQVQNMLRQMIVANVGTNINAAAGAGVVGTVATGVKNAVTGGTVVEDEESGFSVLPAPKGFKGFSSGQTE